MTGRRRRMRSNRVARMSALSAEARRAKAEATCGSPGYRFAHPGYAPPDDRRPSLTRLDVLCVLDVEPAERPGNDEVVVIEHQRARHAVLEQLERHRIDRRLLAVLLPGVAIVIADRHRPAHHRPHL